MAIAEANTTKALILLPYSFFKSIIFSVLVVGYLVFASFLFMPRSFVSAPYDWASEWSLPQSANDSIRRLASGFELQEYFPLVLALVFLLTFVSLRGGTIVIRTFTQFVLLLLILVYFIVWASLTKAVVSEMHSGFFFKTPFQAALIINIITGLIIYAPVLLGIIYFWIHQIKRIMSFEEYQ